MNRNGLSDAAWRRSSRSNGQANCVEVAFLDRGAIAVRDSKDPTGAALVVDSGAWDVFSGGVRGGEFHRP